MIRLLAILAYLAQPAFAQSYPDLFDVRAVADNDILNVRQISSADASNISTLAPKATEIEVVTLSGDGLWGMIGLAEDNGWVSMTYRRGDPVQMSCRSHVSAQSRSGPCPLHRRRPRLTRWVTRSVI